MVVVWGRVTVETEATVLVEVWVVVWVDVVTGGVTVEVVVTV